MFWSWEAWNLLNIESISFPGFSVSETLFSDPDILLRKDPVRMTSGRRDQHSSHLRSFISVATALFTNVPLEETIQILAKKALNGNWLNNTHDLNICEVQLNKLLTIATID